MTSILFIGRTLSGLLQNNVGKTDERGLLCNLFVSGIPALKTEPTDPHTIESSHFAW